MRRITAALLLTSCLAAGEIAQAQSQKPATEPQQEYAQQPSSRDNAGNQSQYHRKNRKEKAKEDKKDQSAQSTCVPQPNTAGEGDPDAPQNRVEYGGGG